MLPDSPRSSPHTTPWGAGEDVLLARGLLPWALELGSRNACLLPGGPPPAACVTRSPVYPSRGLSCQRCSPASWSPGWHEVFDWGPPAHPARVLASGAPSPLPLGVPQTGTNVLRTWTSARTGSASMPPAGTAASVRWASAPRRTTAPAGVRPGPQGWGTPQVGPGVGGAAGAGGRARRADLGSPQMWTSVFSGTSVCSGAARTCPGCSAASVVGATSWTAAAATARVCGQGSGCGRAPGSRPPALGPLPECPIPGACLTPHLQPHPH